jgi:AraC family transcriptional regulator
VELPNSEIATYALDAPPRGLATWVLKRVRDYIDENIGERITLGDLARVAGISRYHFARQFRLRTGESPMGYLRRLKIERAKAMLRAPEIKVSDIAAGLSFTDQSHFTRTFRRLVGLTPRDVRLMPDHDEEPRGVRLQADLRKSG